MINNDAFNVIHSGIEFDVHLQINNIRLIRSGLPHRMKRIQYESLMPSFAAMILLSKTREYK
jgi:hypothetical protein